jgi:hypothetical protein
MNTAIIATLFAACFAAIITASYLLNRTTWHLCQRCFNWHNNIGERSARPPLTVALSNEPKLCRYCRHENHH